jgi:hypothetical protein
MKLLYIIPTILFAVLISCGGNKNAPATNSQSSGRQEPASVENNNPVLNSGTGAVDVMDTSENGKMGSENLIMPVIVSFYSIGQGIDRGQTEKLLAYIQTYEKKAGKKIEYSEVHWGREGENDFCFPLSGFSDSEVKDFLNGAKTALNTAEHVHFLQNQPCRKGR